MDSTYKLREGLNMPDGSNDAAKADNLSVKAPPGPADPLHEVINLLNRVATDSKLALLNPDLAGVVGRLAEQATEPGRLDQPSYRTGAAYAVQDMEKYTGGKPISMPPELRAELVALASTSPGLQNERMQALLAKTADLANRELILDIRRTAQQMARLGPGQDNQELDGRIEDLEKRVGASRGTDASLNKNEALPRPGQGQAASAAPDRAAHENRVPARAETAASTTTRSKASENSAGTPSMEERVNAVPSPGSGQTQVTAAVETAAGTKSTAATATTQPATTTVAEPILAQAETVHFKRQGLAESIVSSARKPRPLDPAPWSVTVPAIGQRIAQFEQRLADGKTERLIQNAEQSGTAVLAAMEQFAIGPGRGIMSKLERVAAQDPGGMPAVISEMRPGGRYAKERVEFDAALHTPAIAAAYKALTDSAERFAGDRYAVANNMQSRKLNPAAADGRFEQMDAALGEQASKLPGREAGKDAMAEMAQKLAELLRKAMAKVEQALGKTAGVKVQAMARPSPSPNASM